MNYNIAIIVNIFISAIISMVISFYGVSFFLSEQSPYFKIFQLIITIILMFTIYAPLKVLILKYMGIEVDETKDLK